MADRPNHTCAGLALFLIPWTAITLCADGAILYSLAKQCIALGYASAPGTIEESTGVLADSGVSLDWGSTAPPADAAVSEGDSCPAFSSANDSNRCDFRVRYSYTVKGRPQVGYRYRYGAESTTRGDVEQLIQNFPVGSRVTVHYNVRDPQDAVLVTGIEPQDLFVLHFLTPFNCIMLGGWIILGRLFWCASTRPPAGWARIIERNGRTWVDLAPETQLLAPPAVVGILSFLSIFAIVVPFGFNPPWLVLALTWWLIAAALVAVILRGLRPAIWMTHVLVLDQGSRELELPAQVLHKAGGTPAGPVSFAAVTDISVERVPAKDSGWVYAPTLHSRRSDGRCEIHQLVKWQNAVLAQQLTDWLRERILGEPVIPDGAR